MKFCGPKFSICCTILSAWAIIQLGLMGIFFFIQSPSFIEDLYIPDTVPENDPQAFINAMEASYSQISTNCWIATALYGATFAVSGWQMWLNLKA